MKRCSEADQECGRDQAIPGVRQGDASEVARPALRSRRRARQRVRRKDRGRQRKCPKHRPGRANVLAERRQHDANEQRRDKGADTIHEKQCSWRSRESLGED